MSSSSGTDATPAVHGLPRRAGRRWRTRLGWVGTVLVLLAVAGAAWWVANSSLFDMRSLSVGGNTRLSDHQVARLSGLEDTTNVLWLSTPSIATRLGAHPWIKSARVSRSLPGRVSIEIRERLPVAVLSGERRYLVAKDGTILSEASEPTALPTFEASGFDAAPGNAINAERTPPLAVLAGLPLDVRRGVSRAVEVASGDVVLLMRDSSRVVYGSLDQRTAKAATLRALLAWARREGVDIEYLDIREPSAPAVRLR